ncbi:MAG: hypothetical protein ACRD88_05480, partial [Terriglobia bacterium]
HQVGSENDAYAKKPDYARGADDAILNEPGFPRLLFIESLYNGDPTNWWIPNPAALESLLRSAGMKVVARPHPQVLVAEPERYLGKVTYNKLVMPRYGKPGKPLSPGPQQVEPELWAELLRKVKAEEP